MKWQPMDDRSASAQLTYNGITVSGIFHFNEADELVRFDTNDRWQDGSPPKKIPWSANIEGYRVARPLNILSDSRDVPSGRSDRMLPTVRSPAVVS